MDNRGRVISDYVSEFSNPMSARKGDSIRVIRKNDGKYKSWYWCRSDSGIEAWVPEVVLSISGDRATLSQDYNSRELDSSENEIVDILYEMGGWSWCRNSRGKEGWLPSDILGKT